MKKRSSTPDKIPQAPARQKQQLLEEQMMLRLEAETLAGFMQNLPGLAWIKDTEGRYVYANDAAAQAFQVTREQLYGKTDSEVFPPEIAAQFQENDRRALES